MRGGNSVRTGEDREHPALTQLDLFELRDTKTGPWGMPHAVRARLRALQPDTPPVSPPNDRSRQASSRTSYRVGALERPCSRCGLVKQANEFEVTPLGTLGSWCRPCRLVKKRDYRKPGDPVAGHLRHLRRTYGLTKEQYAALFDQQRGMCAICNRPESNRGGRHGNAEMRLSVDHDHQTGKIRGLLCMRCNTAIGALDHDQARLQAAIRYLESTR
jgi:hypothetical protein